MEGKGGEGKGREREEREKEEKKIDLRYKWGRSTV